MCGYSSTLTSRCRALQRVEHQLGRFRIGRGLAGKGPKAFDEAARFVERGDAHQSMLLAQNVVDIAAAGGDMHDSRSLAGDDVGTPLGIAAAVDDSMAIDARFAGERRD